MKKEQEDFKKFANSNGIPSTTLLGYEQKVFIPSIKNMTPYIFETTEKRGSLMDVFSRLMMESTIFFGTGVTSEVANIIIAQLLWLESQGQKEIRFMINSPGGSVYAGNGIIDTMNFITPDIATINVSLAASMGAVILSNGTKGKRSALKHARTMIHQVSSGTEGTLSDMEIALKETISIKNDLYVILAENTGKTIEQIEKDCQRDYWMKSTEAKEYGLIDSIVVSKKKQ